MDFNQPDLMLHLFWLLPLLLFVVWMASRRRRSCLLLLLGDSPLGAELVSSVSRARRRWRTIFFLLGVCLLVVAMARPRWGTHLHPRPIASRDVLVVFDVSKSMLASDVPPTRLEHARLFIRRLASELAGNRFGLITFAGTAFLECPLTRNLDGFLLFLDDVGTDSIPVGGTNIEAALNEALTAFHAAEGRHRAILLITDGDALEGKIDAVLKKLVAAKIPVFTVGIGDPVVGSYIQFKDHTFLKDKQGKRVKTRLNEVGLREIATRTGGIYVRSTAVQDGLNPVVQRIRAMIPKKQKGGVEMRPVERYQLPLLAGICCFLLFLFIGERRRLASAMALVAFLGLVVSVPSVVAAPAPPDRAVGALPEIVQPSAGTVPRGAAMSPGTALPSVKVARQQEHKELAKWRARLDQAKTERERAYCHYNLGVHFQRLGDRKEAEKQYRDVLRLAGDDSELRAAAYLNLGVLRHQPQVPGAQGALARDPDKAMAELADAQSCYREAMRSGKTRKDAAFDQELALRARRFYQELKKFKQQMQQKQEDAAKKTRAARDAQKKANQMQNSGEKQKQQQKAQRKSAQARQALQQLAKQAQNGGMSQVSKAIQQVSEQVSQAQKKQQDAVRKDLSRAARQEAGQEAEKKLNAALQALNGSDSSKKKGNSKNQQNSQQRKQSEMAKKGQPKGNSNQQNVARNRENQSASGKQEKSKSAAQKQAEAEKIRKLDKTQALRILADMQQQERNLKTEMKQLRAAKLRYKSVEKDW